MNPKSNKPLEILRKRIQQCIEASPYKDKIKSLALFGSYANQTAKGNSDIDLLIVFRDRIGYFTLVRIQNALSHALEREVDLVTKDALSPHFRDEVLKEAILIYEK